MTLQKTKDFNDLTLAIKHIKKHAFPEDLENDTKFAHDESCMVVLKLSDGDFNKKDFKRWIEEFKSFQKIKVSPSPSKWGIFKMFKMFDPYPSTENPDDEGYSLRRHCHVTFLLGFTTVVTNSLSTTGHPLLRAIAQPI